MPDAAYGAAFGESQKRFLGPAEQGHQLLPCQALALVKVRQGAALRELVPGANQLAVVAAINAVAHQRPELQRNGSGVFYGQVGNAAPGIELVRRNDGPRGADIDAGAAGAAVRRHRGAGRQSQVHIDFTEEEHRARLAVEQQRVLAAPALAAAGSQLSLQHRRRVGEGAMAQFFDMRGDPLGEFLQAGAHDLVVIAAPGIHRNDALRGPPEPAEFDGLPFTGHRRCSGR